MVDLKKKPNSSLRVPKPKKKLGLVVPPPLRMPHEELILQPRPAEPDSSTMPSQTSQTRHSEKDDESMPGLTSLTRHTSDRDNEAKDQERPVAPTRDFSRVANSISREAVPAGLFRGKSKQLYDCLYALTRGAVVPSRTVRISRPKLMAGANIGSRVTFEANIAHLSLVGLIEVRTIPGQHDGNEYTVNLPEEIGSTMPSLTSQTSLTGYAQKLVRLVRLETSQTRHTSSQIESTNYDMPYTSFNTIDDDDTLTLHRFAMILAEAAREIAGGRVFNGEQEREKWEECARLLADELKSAASRADTVSSVPAFFATHLRRKFAARVRATSRSDDSRQTEEIATPEKHPREGLAEKGMESTSARPPGSRYSLDQCRRYAEHLQKTGQGITSPGGYATTIYRTGEADSLIERFLTAGKPENQQDITRCPDCRGTGFVYPEGIERGIVARCKHPRFEVALRLFEQINRLRLSHSGDAQYGDKLLLEELRVWCEKEGVSWSEEIASFLLNA